MTPRSRLGLPLVAVGVLASGQLQGQDRITIEFYHGKAKSSQVFRVDRGEGFKDDTRAHFTFSVDPGTEVCVLVANAHSINYTYSLDAKVDTSSPKLPDISSYTSLLAPLLAAAQEAAAK